jgi:hypothetical protein
LVENPDTPNETFLREVDENLRRDQMRDLARQYGGWLFGAVLLFLAAVGGYLYWQNRQKEKSAAQSEELVSIYNDIGSGKTDVAIRRLKPLEEAGNDLTRSLAILTEAALALDSNDRATAIAKYQALSNDGDAPEPYRNLATIRSATLQFDSLKPHEVISRMEPLAKPGEPWFGTAAELTAMAYIKQGRKDAAAKLFAAIAADKQAPSSLRTRSAQIAGTLGIDATAALAQQAQQE